MTRPLCMLLAIAMLFMSIDAAIDITRSGHSHADAAARQGGQATHSDMLVKSKSHTDGSFGIDHCERCCHGHISMATANPLDRSRNCAAGHPIAHAPVSVTTLPRAPPTPPPNA